LDTAEGGSTLSREDPTFDAAAKERIAALEAELAAARETIARLEQRVDEDDLTGLINRRGFDRLFSQAVAFADRYAEEAVLVLIDIDDFKMVNDTLGHLAGDKALLALAGLMRQKLRRSDAVARIGGDEFAVLLRNTTLELAAQRAARLASDIAALPLDYQGHAITLSVSFGFARCEGSDPATIFQQADTAMYHMKSNRKR
jgi:diguanylate cyclase